VYRGVYRRPRRQQWKAGGGLLQRRVATWPSWAVGSPNIHKDFAKRCPLQVLDYTKLVSISGFSGLFWELYWQARLNERIIIWLERNQGFLRIIWKNANIILNLDPEINLHNLLNYSCVLHSHTQTKLGLKPFFLANGIAVPTWHGRQAGRQPAPALCLHGSFHASATPPPPPPPPPTPPPLERYTHSRLWLK
jgi:hypothetical protein